MEISRSSHTAKLLAIIFATILLVSGASIALNTSLENEREVTNDLNAETSNFSLNLNTTSIKVHNIFSSYMMPEQVEGYSMFQLDIEHRVYDRIYVRRGETKYLVLNYTVYVDEIEGDFEVMAVPSSDIVINATEMGMYLEIPNLQELSLYVKPTGFKAEVRRLPECCTLDVKYVICDNHGYSYQEDGFPPQYDRDPISFLVIVSFTAGGRSWRVYYPKVFVENLLVTIYHEYEGLPIMYHGPMVSVHIDGRVMSYHEFWDWAEGLHGMFR